MKEPGRNWRILARDGERDVKLANEGVFDELVIDEWLHLEQMDDRKWWMRLGDARLDIEIQADGTAKVSIERGVYAREAEDQE